MEEEKKEEKKEDVLIENNSGRSQINSRNRKNVSIRAIKGKLEVIRTKTFFCPKCHNKKFLDTIMMGTKCSKCGTRVKL